MIIICHRTLPAYRPYFSIFYEDWLESRTVLHYLDLAVPNDILSKKLYDKVCSKYDAFEYKAFYIMEKFYPDDCIYAGVRDRRRDFFSHALSTKEDRIGRQLFDVFHYIMHACGTLNLQHGEFAVRFLNMTTVFGAGEWRETDIRASNKTHPVLERIFWSIYPAILKGICRKRSEHPLLLKKFWDLFCTTAQTRFELFLQVPDAEHLEFMLEVANRVKFDFWGMRNGSDYFTERIVLAYIRSKRFELVELLLKYGFALEKGIPHKMRRTCWSFPISVTYFIFEWEEPISIKFLVWLLASVYTTHPVSYLVKLPEFIELYRKLYRSLPLPSEPPSVFKKNLEQVFSYHTLHFAVFHRLNDAVTNDASMSSPIEDMTESYRQCDVHPSDSNGVVLPKLSHLSRCVIRERLAANYQLPTAIDDSRLPTLVKSFLKLEC